MAHRVLEELASACQVCDLAPPPETALVADCDGPCHDPTHHHHHPHHDEQRCPTCQSAGATPALLFNRIVLIATAGAGRMRAPPALPPAQNHDIRLSPARGPPAARIA
jgi:hypothetical protein